VAYRFTLASLILLAFALARKINLRFTARQHLFFGLQGVLLFSLNYLLVYLAELRLTSGLVAVIFSTLVFMNIFIGALFLGTPVRPTVVIGALWRRWASPWCSSGASAFSLQDRGFVGCCSAWGNRVRLAGQYRGGPQPGTGLAGAAEQRVRNGVWRAAHVRVRPDHRGAVPF
jgi:hypothetical protein